MKLEKKFLNPPMSPPTPFLPLNTPYIIASKLPNTASTPIKYPMGWANEVNVLPMALTALLNSSIIATNRFCRPFTID
jgi:hypothetical protein